MPPCCFRSSPRLLFFSALGDLLRVNRPNDPEREGCAGVSAASLGCFLWKRREMKEPRFGCVEVVGASSAAGQRARARSEGRGCLLDVMVRGGCVEVGMDGGLTIVRGR